MTLKSMLPIPAALVPAMLLLGALEVHAQLSPEEPERVRRAVPAEATMTPAHLQKLLIFSRAEGYQHSAIHRVNTALDAMGKKAGAFVTEFSDDLLALGDFSADTTPRPFDPMSFFNEDSLESLLQRAAAYRPGASREALTGLDEFMRGMQDLQEARRAMETRFLEFLHGDGSPEAKQFVATRLALIGSDASVRPLIAMLTDSSAGDMALYALESIGGSSADTALLEILPRVRGRTLVGVINVLGTRRVEAAIADLTTLVNHAEPVVAEAVIAALGKIGAAASAGVLERARERASGAHRISIAHAWLTSADRLAEKGYTAQALAIFRVLTAPQEPRPVREAALRGTILAEPLNAASAIMATLKSADTDLHPMAIRLLGRVSAIESVREIAGVLPSLPTASQIMLVTALAAYRDGVVQSVVSKACTHKQPEVRLAALKTLGVMGDAGAVELLARVAATSRGSEQREARNSLAVLRGQDVDVTLAALFMGAGTPLKIELIRSAGERRALPAVGQLMQAARDPSAKVRLEAAKALKTAAGAMHVDPLIDLLVNARDDAYRRELEIAVAAAARKIPDQSRQDEAIRARYASTSNPTARASLATVLGALSAPASLPVLRTALEENDRRIRRAAIQGLSGWPGAEPLQDLWRLAMGGAKDPAERTLALRGAVRLIGLDTSLSSDRMIQMYREALNAAPNVDECRLLLSAVGQTSSIAALRLAAGYLEDRRLQHEAEAAMLSIAERMTKATRREAAPELQRLLTKSTNESNIARTRALLQSLGE